MNDFENKNLDAENNKIDNPSVEFNDSVHTDEQPENIIDGISENTNIESDNSIDDTATVDTDNSINDTATVDTDNSIDDTATVNTDNADDNTAAINTDNISDNTINENTNNPEHNKKNKRKKYSYKKSIAVGLAGVLIGGASMGYFLGVGLNTSGRILNGASEIANGTFSFSDTAADENKVNAESLNLVADEKSISATIASVENAVVNISIKSQTVNFFNQVYESEGAGSGIIYKVDGDTVYIVTNNHVIDGASTVTISVTGTEQVSAKLVGKDSTADIAVISVSKKDMEDAGITNISAAKFSDSDATEVGESVIAIGNALGRGKTATLGIISAQNKEINIDGKKFTVIQTDAAINPGNSGGALINTSGEVIGINTAKLSDSSVEGTGYAIPSNTFVSIADQLIANGSVNKAYLGISGVTISDEFRYMYGITVKGVYISKVETGSAAEQAGLQVSDIITGVDGTSITTIEELSQIISSHQANDSIKLSIVRNGVTSMEINATLADANSNF